MPFCRIRREANAMHQYPGCTIETHVQLSSALTWQTDQHMKLPDSGCRRFLMRKRSVDWKYIYGVCYLKHKEKRWFNILSDIQNCKDGRKRRWLSLSRGLLVRSSGDAKFHSDSWSYWNLSFVAGSEITWD